MVARFPMCPQCGSMDIAHTTGGDICNDCGYSGGEVTLTDKDKEDKHVRIEGHAMLHNQVDAGGTVFTKDAIVEAWKDFLRRGDFTVYLNFDKTRPVGRIVPEASGVDYTGLKVVAELKVGFGIAGRTLKKSVDGEITTIEEVEVYGVSITEKPLPGCEITNVKKAEESE